MSENQKPGRFLILKKFFMIVGIIAVVFIFLAILLVAYVIIKKPLGISADLFGQAGQSSETTYDHPLLSPSQEKTLQTLGVDLKTVPTAITPAQEKCTVEFLGQERVTQIKSGAAPSVSDYLKAKSCF
ncbi:MAG: hypothetical protein WC719_03525 [Patescibacteria group bacterium]|jgi:hypothetical protein